MKLTTLVVSMLLMGLSVSLYAGTCKTPKVATLIPRTSIDCQEGTFVWYCYDESWSQGGCDTPNDKDFNCIEKPMSNPVKYKIYAPQWTNGVCNCVQQSENTPSGQIKGVATATPCGQPEPPEEVGGGS